MAVTYTSLAGVDFGQLHHTHNEAFADYQVDVSYMTEERMRLRGIKNNVKYEYSVAAHDGAKMVGFTLIGIDDWQDELAAFDAATGIIPTHRGKGIAKKMFEFALPGLKEHGVKKFLLEVLRPNDAAIKAYRKTGFQVTREFDCFKLELETARQSMKDEEPTALKIDLIGKETVMEFSHIVEWQPSWENSFAAIRRIPDKVLMFGAFIDGLCAGIIVYYPQLNWVMSLIVRKEQRRRGIGRTLVRHLVNNLPGDLAEIELINVDNRDQGMVKFLQSTGFEFIIGQYEMPYDL